MIKLVGTFAVKVRLRSLLADIAGVQSIEVDVPFGLALRDVVKMLTERFGSDFPSAVLDSNGNLRPSVMVAIDGYLISVNQVEKIALTLLSPHQGPD